MKVASQVAIAALVLTAVPPSATAAPGSALDLSKVVDRAIAAVGAQPAEPSGVIGDLAAVERSAGLHPGDLQGVILEPGDVQLDGFSTSRSLSTVRQSLQSATDKNMSLIQDELENGFRLAVVLHNEEAPTSIEFDVDVADGLGLTPRPDGTVAVTDESGYEFGYFEAPWAVDAAGQKLRTSFEVSAGGNLVQAVSVDESTRYPVVADPSYSVCTPFGFSVGLCSTLTRSETLQAKRWLDQYGTSSSTWVGLLCGIAGPVSWRDVTKNRIRAACGAALAIFQTNVARNINSAAGTAGRCLRVIVYSVPGNVGAFQPTRVVSC